MPVEAEESLLWEPEGLGAGFGEVERDAFRCGGEREEVAAVAGEILVGAFDIQEVLDQGRDFAAAGAAAGEMQDVERVFGRDEAEREDQQVVLLGEDLFDLKGAG